MNVLFILSMPIIIVMAAVLVWFAEKIEVKIRKRFGVEEGRK